MNKRAFRLQPRAQAHTSTATGASIMQTLSIGITNRLGLHARAAAQIVRLASQFSCSVWLIVNGRRASARSMVAVMMLAASVGSTITLETSGPDEAAAMVAMVQLIGDGFGEAR
jgi:phosphocarrier protein